VLFRSARTTSGTWTTAADRLRLGATNGTAVNLTVDDVYIGSGAMPSQLAAAGTVILASAVPGSSFATIGAVSTDAATGTRQRILVPGAGYRFVCVI